MENDGWDTKEVRPIVAVIVFVLLMAVTIALILAVFDMSAPWG